MIEDLEKYKQLEQKLDDICKDLSNNVTKIFLRKDLHLSFLIAFCSVLHYNLEGKTSFGLIDCLLAGDSDQGKSEIAERLTEFFNLGVIHNCGSAKRTGILGGWEKMGSNGKFFIKWGVIPKNDRQLVILEEIKDADEDVIGNLRSMRSKKEAELVGTTSRKTPARTRIIMLSNPRSSKKDVESYAFGVSIIKELMIHLEDVRRLDFAMVISKGEIDWDKCNELIEESIKLAKSKDKIDPKFSSDAWKKLILWIWTRSVDQVTFEEGFGEMNLKLSNQLCSDFTDTIPLITSGSMRHKLTKIAASIAAMTFNTNGDNHESLLVEKVHLQFAYNFLVKIYSNETFGYKAFSIDDDFSKRLRDDDIKFLRQRLMDSQYAKDLIELMLHADDMDRFSFADWLGCNLETAGRMLGDLVRKRALFRSGHGYIKSPGFTRLLKTLLKENNFKPLNDISDDSEF